MTIAHEKRDLEATHAIEVDGTLHVPSFSLPFSGIASRQARDAYVVGHTKSATARAAAADNPPLIPEDIEAVREKVDDEIVRPLLEKQLARWPDMIEIASTEIRGIYAEVFTPKAGIGERNPDRVLVNVHGGGFMVGARAHGQLESIPIAALGRIKVVSVDYRMAPEHHFPAASEDLGTVYEHLLGAYDPKNIGIYGSSAGGVLAAQAVPWFLEQNLPLPGAIGMFGATGQSPYKGDSAALTRLVYEGADFPQHEADLDLILYFRGADVTNRLVSPMLWPDVLTRFPPSLLVTGGRAFEMSSIIDAHNKLTLAGACSRLHLWDGLGHCFYLDADLPESRDFEKVVVDFFAEMLGGA